MKSFFFIIFIFILSCSTKQVNRIDDTDKFKDELNMDKFIIKLKAYSNKNPYPNIDN